MLFHSASVPFLIDEENAQSPDPWSSGPTGHKRGRKLSLEAIFRQEFWEVVGRFRRAWNCQNEVGLGEHEVPDGPHVQRTRYSVKTLVEEAS